MSGITSKHFGITKNGEEATLYTITNSNQMSVSITDFGGTVTAVKVPDRKGIMTDVVLGYDKLSDYEENDGYFGALVGRYANRIAKGTFRLNGEVYRLAQNNGENHLHGGNIGFSNRIWQAQASGQTLKLTLFSPHMEEGYPGNLQVSVIYSLDDQNCLSISYEAESDQDTVCNLTNHSYFNLKGHQGGLIEDHQLKIYASAYLPVDDGLIPTGEYQKVENTPFDFREFKEIGADIEKAGGYDHNYVLDKGESRLRAAAKAYCPDSGIIMNCLTTQPGIQFYTGNFISPRTGKAAASYEARQGFCLETQAFPDAVNQPAFPSAVLKAGETYQETTIFEFEIKS